MSLTEKGLPACIGRSPVFPRPAEVQPQSADRAALIAQIVDASVIAKMKPDTVDAPLANEALFDSATQERRQRPAFN